MCFVRGLWGRNEVMSSCTETCSYTVLNFVMEVCENGHSGLAVMVHSRICKNVAIRVYSPPLQH